MGFIPHGGVAGGGTMGPTGRTHVVLLTLTLLLVTVSPTALGHTDADAATDLTVEALERDDCPPDRAFCFEVTHGSLEELEPDTTVRLTFVNQGQDVHNVAITRLSDADPDRTNTPMKGMFAGTAEEVQPGTQQTFFFHVPSDADGIYLWCHVVGHESAGMWLAQDLPGTPGSDDGGEIPALGPAALLGTLVVGGLMLTRVRHRR